MQKSGVVATTAGVILVIASAAAQAQQPPEGYVETCNITNYSEPGVDCQACGATADEPDVCRNLLEPQGYEYVCKSWGDVAYNEVYCRGTPATGTSTATGTESSSDSDGGCHVSPAGEENATWPGLLLFALAALGRRACTRRRSRHR